mgnify:CR=1 FL=1
MKNILALYGSHDSSATFIDNDGRLRIIELERHAKKRYAAFSKHFENRLFGISDEQRRSFLEYLSTKCDLEKIEHVAYQWITPEDQELFDEFFPNLKSCDTFNHHPAHAYCGHYQSGFKSSIIFSIDGGGVDDGETITTKAFMADDELISDLGVSEIDYGTSYQIIGKYISEINKRKNEKGFSDETSWAGKIMGLCAYGKVREEWIDIIQDYYLTEKKIKCTEGPDKDKWMCGSEFLFREGVLLKLFPEKKIADSDELDNEYQDILSGEESYDLAATSQFVFEKLLFKMMKPQLDKYPERDVVLVGGCALNVLYNQKLYEYMKEHWPKRKLYVPPNPNDCGLSLGFFLGCPTHLGGREEFFGKDFVYDGIELLDKEDLQSHVKERNAKKVTTKEIVDIIKRGEIIGLVYGDSEIGPRALGNRSIICDPSFENMKDILNKKVKFREWYRPFAPVCLFEDAETYFDNPVESNYMSFAPKVKKEYQEKLKSITHVDETSRLQTVSKGGHKVFTDILNELKDRNEIPVILNTSFNIKGFPILTTIEDALHVLDNTELDHVVVEGYIFSK